MGRARPARRDRAEGCRDGRGVASYGGAAGPLSPCFPEPPVPAARRGRGLPHVPGQHTSRPWVRRSAGVTTNCVCPPRRDSPSVGAASKLLEQGGIDVGDNTTMSTSDLSRRSVIKRAAVVGAATAWATPTIQSIASPAFAAGSPPGACGSCMTGGGQIVTMAGAPVVFMGNTIPKLSFGLGQLCCEDWKTEQIEVNAHPTNKAEGRHQLALHDRHADLHQDRQPGAAAARPRTAPTSSWAPPATAPATR